MNETYPEEMQYLPWVGTHKTPPDGEKNDPPNDLGTKALTCLTTPKQQNRFYVGVKRFTYTELADALRKGHCVKRIGTYANGTRILIIDLDNDNNENITPEELDSFCKSRDNIEWTKGGSGRDFRYHIVKLLDNPIYSKEESEEQTKAILRMLAEHTGRLDDIQPDKHQDTYLQWCYGCPQDRMEYRELPDTEYWCRQITKGFNYQIIKVDPAQYQATSTNKRPAHGKLMPYTTAQLANLLNDKHLRASKLPNGAYVNPKVSLEGRRFDCYEPRIINKSVQIGHRYNTALAWIYRLVPQFYRCKELGFNYTEDDLEYTFHILCKRNFEKADEWWTETGKSMLELLKSELQSNENLDYKDIEFKYQSSHKNDLYKRYGYNNAVTTDILKKHSVGSPNERTAVFSDRKELVALLDDVRVSYTSFRAYAAMIGYTVVYEDDKRASHKYDYIDGNIKRTDNIWFYTTPNESVKSYCKRQGYSYMSLYKLYSGTKAQYNRVLAVTQDAIKAMHKFFENPTPIRLNDDEDYELPDDLPFYPEDLPD